MVVRDRIMVSGLCRVSKSENDTGLFSKNKATCKNTKNS